MPPYFFFIVISFASFFVASSVAQENKPKFEVPYITVPGNAFVEVRPDIAILTLGAISEKPKAAEASAEAARASKGIVEMLMGMGVSRSDIKTSNLSISPTYVEERDPRTQSVTARKLTGYRASNTYTVRIREVEKAGAIATKAIEAGANTFQSLFFDLTNREEVLDSVRASAVSNALRRAGLYAVGANMRTGRLLALDPQADPRQWGQADLPSRRTEPGQVITIPVEPGLIRIEAIVFGTWELVPQ